METVVSRSSCQLPVKPHEQDVLPGSRTGLLALRLGLRYVRGLREEAAHALVHERTRAPFTSIHDLTRRVPELRKDELTTLAEIGALNKIGNPLRRQGDQLPLADCRMPIAPDSTGF